MGNSTSLARALLGLDAFRVLAVHESTDKLASKVETKRTFDGSPTCGARARAKDGIRVDIIDPPCFGRPARHGRMKRRGDAGLALIRQRTGLKPRSTYIPKVLQQIVPGQYQQNKWQSRLDPGLRQPENSGFAGGRQCMR